MGIKFSMDDCEYLLGNEKLMIKNNIHYPKIDSLGSVIMVSKNNNYVGTVVISDTIKQSSLSIVKMFNLLDINNIYLVSSEQKETVKKVAHRIGITNFLGEISGLEKALKIKELKKSGDVLFIGNDLEALKEASVGVSLDDTISDIVLKNTDILTLQNVFLESIKLEKNFNYCLILVLLLKFICLLLGLSGILNILFILIIDIFISLILIFNGTK